MGFAIPVILTGVVGAGVSGYFAFKEHPKTRADFKKPKVAVLLTLFICCIIAFIVGFFMLIRGNASVAPANNSKNNIKLNASSIKATANQKKQQIVSAIEAVKEANVMEKELQNALK
jgi:phosphate/sulfate permease